MSVCVEGGGGGGGGAVVYTLGTLLILGAHAQWGYYTWSVSQSFSLAGHTIMPGGELNPGYV